LFETRRNGGEKCGTEIYLFGRQLKCASVACAPLGLTNSPVRLCGDRLPFREVSCRKHLTGNRSSFSTIDEEQLQPMYGSGFVRCRCQKERSITIRWNWRILCQPADSVKLFSYHFTASANLGL